MKTVSILLLCTMFGAAGCQDADRKGVSSHQATAEPGMGLVGNTERSAPKSSGPLIMIALDALHPGYLELDSHGDRSGKPGDWLMPNIHAFLDRATWFPAAKDFLPAATDMNHLNALSGTNSALTGEVGVSAMMTGWQAPQAAVGSGSQWKPILTPTELTMLRDDKGRQIDTLFHAFKRSNPDAKTAFISGKGWVAEMFRASHAVDFIVTGQNHPEGIAMPEKRSMIDPPGDGDGWCKPRSWQQQSFAFFLEKNYTKFPSDQWVVDAALKTFELNNPQMTYILLAQQDDEGHALGSAWDPSEFTLTKSRFPLLPGCVDKPEYHYVSRRNNAVYRAPILAAVREVDRQFGRLMAGLEQRGILADASVVVLSDHGMITHLKGDKASSGDALDIRGLLAKNSLIGKDDFFPYTATSFGLLYWRNDKGRVAMAKSVLASHKVKNPETGVVECPWYVLDRDDMQRGVPGVALPGELYHHYFVDTDREHTVVWPDLVLLAKNGWQLPTYGGLAANIGLGFPKTKIDVSFLRFSPFLGGHGSFDTRPIMMAFSLPGQERRVLPQEVTIADIASTLASLYGLELRSSTVGQDLSAWLQ